MVWGVVAARIYIDVTHLDEERRWTIIALRSLIFYFWSNIELTWHECSFMSQITTYEEKMFLKKFLDLI